MLFRAIGLCFVSTLLLAQDFDPDWKVIPNAFKGDNLVQIVKSLETAKGEFESTDEFNSRLARLAPRDRTFFFFCDSIPFDVKYDADAKAFTFARISYDAYLEIAKIDKSGKSYYGSNAFGVIKKVKELWNTAYDLNDRAWKRDSGISFTLPCSQGLAPAIKEDMGMAFLVKLVPDPRFGQKNVTMDNPFLNVFWFNSEATVTNPLEYKSKTYILVCDVQKVVVFRKSDRSILLAVEPKKTK
jgi:hypothetical protein